MPRIAKLLPDSQVKAAKPGTGKTPRRIFYGGGLYLEISPAGPKYWCLKYLLNGKECRMGLGAYPSVKLGDARTVSAEGAQ